MRTHDIVGRGPEMAKLDKLLLSGRPEFLALYGRRRVGKTFLIRQHLQNQIVFDLSGTKEGAKSRQLENFFDEYLARTNGKQETKPPKSWPEAFRYLNRYLQTLPVSDTKHVVFLDEMPWMDTPKSDFISALEFFWNQHGSRQNNLLLIACGSASSWIRKNLVNARGGLYNRVTERMKLRPFNLHETEAFLQKKGLNFSKYQVLELYMALGGVPFYLESVERGLSVPQLLDKICFSPSGKLNEEYAHLYWSLFKNAGLHLSIVETLAKSPQGLTRKAIGLETKMDESHLSRSLEELEESDFITRYPPLLNKKKEAIYKLTDLYSLFYLKFVKPNKGFNQNVWEQLSKQSTYKSWSGYAYENICMMHITQIKAALGISGVFTQHSSWIYKGNDALPGAQIDMVIERADNIIHLCEAKFTADNFALTADYAAQLRLRKSVFRQATNTKKTVFTTLVSTLPALQNQYYWQEIDTEITMDKLFEP